MLYAWIPFAGAAVLVALTCLLERKNKSFPMLFVLGAVLFALIGFKGYFSDAFPSAIYGYNDVVDPLIAQNRVVLAFVRWGVLFSEITAVTYALTGSFAMRRVAATVALPVTAISLFFLTPTLLCYTSDLPAEVWNYGIDLPAGWRICGYLLELTLTVAVGTLALHGDIKTEDPIGKDVSKHTLVGAVCTMPFLTQGALFGEGEKVITIGDPLQFLWIALIVGLLLGIYFLYRNSDKKEKNAVMTFLTVYLFTHYNSIYWHGVTVKRLPLQLCNLAAYLLVILLFFRSQKFFDFIFIANSAGCIIAIATVTEETPMFGFWAMHYFVEHTFVYIIPLLYVMLGLFEMPKGKRGLLHFGVGYTAYVAGCVLLNAIANGVLLPNENLNHAFFNDANYFYTLTCPVPSLSALFDAINVGGFTVFGTTFSVGYLAFVYFVFAALAVLEYYGYVGVAKAWHRFTEKAKNT